MERNVGSGLSRREFLHDAAIAAGLMAVAPAMATGPGRSGTAHSRIPLGLFLTADEVPALRQKVQNQIFRSYWQELLEADLAPDRRFLEKEIDLHNHIRHIDRACKILEREAFVYLVTGDRKRGALGHLAVRRLLEYPKWDYFLEAGVYTIGLQRAPATTMAMSLAYDWLGDILSKEERREMLRQIGDKGCEPCYRSLFGMRYPDKVVGWSFDPESYWEERDMRRWPEILNKTNLKAVPMGALAVGAATLEGVDERTGRWWEMVEHSYRTFVHRFQRDGSYDEGGSYWDYTALHMAVTVEMLARKGMDLFDLANFLGMLEYALALQMPHHGNPHYLVNFGDNGRGFDSAVGFWTARRSRDGLSQYAAINHADRHSHYSVIWFDDSLVPTGPSRREHLKHLALDWVIARSGYELEDLVVAMRSGGPANHEHADRNSVILKCYGEVLLADIKRPPYDHQHPAWMLRTAPAHNTVLIDGQGHQYHDGKEGTNASQAAAKVVRIGERQGYWFWASDATHAYKLVNPDVKAVTRTVIVAPGIPCLVVLDKLHKESQPSLFAARWHVENSDNGGEAICKGDSFTVMRPQARLFAACTGSSQLALKADKHPVPESAGVFPFVEVTTVAPSLEAMLITVACPLKLEQPDPVIRFTDDGKVLGIAASLESKRLRLLVFDRGTLPEFEIKEIAC